MKKHENNLFKTKLGVEEWIVMVESEKGTK